jgi:hypothetical protein
MINFGLFRPIDCCTETNNRSGQTPLSLTPAECCQMIAVWELDVAKWSTLFISTSGNCTRERTLLDFTRQVLPHSIRFQIRKIEVWKKTLVCCVRGWITMETEDSLGGCSRERQTWSNSAMKPYCNSGSKAHVFLGPSVDYYLAMNGQIHFRDPCTNWTGG